MEFSVLLKLKYINLFSSNFLILPLNFIMPETGRRTMEEIERHFADNKLTLSLNKIYISRKVYF